MAFHSINQFFAMGGFAAYVWSAYGVALFALGLFAWLPKRRMRKILKQIEWQQRFNQES